MQGHTIKENVPILKLVARASNPKRRQSEMEMRSNSFSFFGAFKFFRDQSRSEGNLWDNARFILADVPLNENEAPRILPFGLKPSDPPMATLFIVDYTKNSFTAPYHEAALLVHVRHLFGSGFHCPWMIVDDDTAMIYGRELLGYPKKMGEITFKENGDTVVASVTRRGVQVLSMEGKRGGRQPSPAPVFDVKTFNVGGPGGWFMYNPIWMFRPKEVIRESYDLDVNIAMEPSEWDPIAKFVSGQAIAGRFVVMDIVRSKYNVPVGLSGPQFIANNYNMRFR